MSSPGSSTNLSQNSSPYATSRQISVVYLIVVGSLGTVGNSMVLFVLWRYPKLRTATNMFIVNLAFCDLVMSILDNALSIVSTWNGRWMFGHSGCLGYGFLYYFFISNTVSMLAAISVDRYFYITKPGQIKAWRITRTRAGIMILIIYIYVLLFTLPPLAGWSSFVVEKDFFSGCYIHYSDQNPASLAYSVISSIFLYLVPLIVMLFCYSKIFYAVRQSTHRTMTRLASSTPASIRKKYPILKRTHVQTAKMIVVVIFFSMIVWVPYVVVSLIKAFTGDAVITSTASHVTVLVAKSCVIYNVLIYVVLNRKLKAVIMNLLCCGRAVSISGRSDATKLRISRILSETDREIATDVVRNRLSALQDQQENGSTLSLEKPSPCILRYSADNPGLKTFTTTTSTKLRNGNVKTVEFKVDSGEDKTYDPTSDEPTGSEGTRRKTRRKKLPKIQRGPQENGVLENSVGANQNGKPGGKSDLSSCSESSQKTSNGKLLLTETVTRAEVRRKALRKMNERNSNSSLSNYGAKTRAQLNNTSRDEVEERNCEEVFESPRLANEVGISNGHLSAAEGLDIETQDYLPVDVSRDDFKVNIRHRREDSSSTAIPSSPASTLSDRSSAWEDSSTGVPVAKRSLTSPRQRNGHRRPRKGTRSRERNASLRARLQRSSMDVMQASPNELHEIQNYWKRMSLCLDDIDLDEMV